MPSAISDQQQRLRALDTTTSFIVQAPAGSGKTSLLTQRYLALLGSVATPEEIVAITFTRKAAAEMRARILKALESAAEPEPQQDHEKLTWQLAKAAMARSATLEWNLAESPNRLHIQTIDSLCTGLTRMLPLLSHLGGQPAISEDARHLYKTAAMETLLQLEEKNGWSDDIRTLLIDLDNRFEKLEALITAMLATRDQWLRRLAAVDNAGFRSELEHSLQTLVRTELEQLERLVPDACREQLVASARHAAANLVRESADSPITACLDMPGMPGTEPDRMDHWLGLAELLLTKSGKQANLRSARGVNKNIGFPAGDAGKQAKEDFKRLLQEIADHPAFLDRLHGVRQLPPSTYTDDQWRRLESLGRVLRLAVAQLQLVFADRGEIDFPEVMLRAQRALGDEQEPTDLALMLDYRISHLLVDEFQDTSHGQFELLKRLTAGWQPGDGRTLFCVGDPMQSIYRFREADVGLYLQAREHGIGDVRLEPLTLEVNFRSSATLIEWINQTFSQMFPACDQPLMGAVSYAPSVAVHEHAASHHVELHALERSQLREEAGLVTSLVSETRERHPGESIAILVRSRPHLARILPALRQAGIRVHAIEAEALGHYPVVGDLFALTRALVHPADRIAWLGILRAPWCGMRLADLHTVTQHAGRLPLWSSLQSREVARMLSQDGRERLQRLLPVLDNALALKGRQPLRALVQGTWIRLGGAALVRDAAELDAATLFLDTLEAVSVSGDLESFTQLESELDSLFAPVDPDADPAIQVLTMHKAKGLEFDTVILPGLGRRPRNDDPALLQWTHYPDDQGDEHMLMAPIRATSEENEPIGAFIRHVEWQKQQFEDERLLYVAATRARKRLHLIAGVEFDKNDDPAPVARSLLERLWPAFRDACSSLERPVAEEEDATAGSVPQLERTPAAWTPRLPAPLEWSLTLEHAAPDEAQRPEFLWAGVTARHVGTMVHRYLEWIATEGLDCWSSERVRRSAPAIRAGLATLGVSREQLERASARTVDAICKTLADATGRWILSDNRDARCEYALTIREQRRVRRIVIDRTFIDEQGVRWIVDYKSGYHRDPDLEAFLQQEEERYRQQLQTYARAMRLLDGRETRTALYFPLMQVWHEVVHAG
ncbi:MAG: UvrD-helicase domain-containing protein [Gammaproteobacteria bacterium]